MAAGCRKLAAEPVPSADPFVPLPAMVDTQRLPVILRIFMDYNNRLWYTLPLASTAAPNGLREVARLAPSVNPETPSSDGGVTTPAGVTFRIRLLKSREQ